MLLLSESVQRISDIKKQLHAKYNMTDIGPVRQFFGLEIERDRKNRILHLHQFSVYTPATHGPWPLAMQRPLDTATDQQPAPETGIQ